VRSAAQSSVVVRPAALREVTAILELWRDAGAVAGATDDPAAVRALLARDPEALLVAELRGRLVGCLIAAFDGWRGNMYRLAVHPAHRGRGIGAQLIEAGEERLRAAGARRVTALVVSEDTRAAAVWRRAGYAHDRRIGRLVKNVG
jgi:ribosomal protein S18 acetylase RimI-like enzyme